MRQLCKILNQIRDTKSGFLPPSPARTTASPWRQSEGEGAGGALTPFTGMVFSLSPLTKIHNPLIIPKRIGVFSGTG